MNQEHYKTTKIEAIDVIEDWNLCFHLGNVVKYIARARYKGHRREDIEKALWYLHRHVERIQGERHQEK